MPSERCGASFTPSLLAAVGLVLAIAGALAPPDGSPAEGLARRVMLPLPDWVVVAGVGALSLASLIFLAIALPRARRRRKKGEDEYEIYHEPRKIPPWLAVALILIALMPPAVLSGAIFWYERHQSYAASGSGHIALPHAPAMPSAIPPKPVSQMPREPASAVTTGLFGTIALLIGFGSLGFVLWLLFADRWMRRSPADFDHPQAHLAAAVEDSLEDLRREPDARAAITRIYRNFERALAGAAVPRRPSQTAMEFMRSVLAKLPLPAAPVGALTRLFEIARFSHHPVGVVEREAAWQALTEIRAKLEEEAEAHRAKLS